MIDGGIILMLVGVPALLLEPALGLVAYRRALREAAEDALEQDALIRGVREISAIYDDAALG